MTHKSNKDCQVHAASVLWLVSSRFCFFRNSQKSITDTHTHLLLYRFLKQTYYSCPKMKGRNCPQCGKVSTLCCTRAVHLLIFTWLSTAWLVLELQKDCQCTTIGRSGCCWSDGDTRRANCRKGTIGRFTFLFKLGFFNSQKIKKMKSQPMLTNKRLRTKSMILLNKPRCIYHACTQSKCTGRRLRRRFVCLSFARRLLILSLLYSMALMHCAMLLCDALMLWRLFRATWAIISKIVQVSEKVLISSHVLNNQSAQRSWLLSIAIMMIKATGGRQWMARWSSTCRSRATSRSWHKQLAGASSKRSLLQHQHRCQQQLRQRQQRHQRMQLQPQHHPPHRRRLLLPLPPPPRPPRLP